jgi:hypothetical protein
MQHLEENYDAVNFKLLKEDMDVIDKSIFGKVMDIPINKIRIIDSKFNKFIKRLRRKFSSLFYDALRVQLITKGIIRPDEWDLIKQDIRFDFQEDNNFAELRDSDILNQRIDTLQKIEQYIGRFYSIEHVRRNILMQSEEEIKEIDQQIDGEKDIMAQHAQNSADLSAIKQGESQ